MARMASPYSANTMLTMFWVTRNRSTPMSADTTITPTMKPPCACTGQEFTAGNA
jgi:hypothetical protein